MLMAVRIVTGIFSGLFFLGDENVQTWTLCFGDQAREELLLIREGALARRV